MELVQGFEISLPHIVSAFHLIVWVFAITGNIDNTQRSRIKKMYGQSKDIINPIVGNLTDFKNLLKQIGKSNSNCIIKVVADSKMLSQVSRVAKKQKNIQQIYLYQPYLSEIIKHKRHEGKQKEPKSDIIHKSKKFIKVVQNFQQCISMAESQVQKATKSFRTFQNSHLLIGNFQKINRYRFRLISFINLKASDFQGSFKSFEEFAKIQLPNLNRHLQGMDKNSIQMSYLIQRLRCYYYQAKSFIQRELQIAERKCREKHPQQQYKKHKDHSIQKQSQKREKISKEHQDQFEKEKSKQGKFEECKIEQQILKDSQKQKPLKKYENNQNADIDEQKELKEKFYHSVISIYQQEGLFYHFLNSNLKSVGEQNSNWKELSLPFHHVYNSIKFLYRNELSKSNEFYRKPFYAFRGGRARSSQLKQYEKYKGKTFVEFFGFLSTSLSAKIVADKFVSYSSSIDNPHDFLSTQSTEDQTDEEVIFRFEVNPNSKIHDQKHDYLVNGFFKLGLYQRQGDKQQQVLFNALNVFKLKQVSQQTIRDLFNFQQRAQLQEERQKAKSLTSQVKYKQQTYKLQYYDRKITVVDLQFGHFYNVLLQKNVYNLTLEGKQAKENYIYCMNKIRQYEMFDEGDVYELTNQLEKSYEYLKGKIGLKDSKQQLMKSLLDNKNYFQRLSTVCNKLGRVKQALEYNKIAIKCHKQLHHIKMNSVYNQYYEKLLDMRYKSIQIYQQSSDYIGQTEQLQRQLQMTRSQGYSQKPFSQYNQAKVYFNQAINFYARGKLQESRNRFKKCQRKLKKIISNFSLDVEEQCCYVGGYLINILLRKGPCSFSQFKEFVKEDKKKKRLNQLTEKYGKKQQMEHYSKLSNECLAKVHEATSQRNGIFKSRKQYQKFILNYSTNSMHQRMLQNETQKDRIINSIRQKILKISVLPLDSQNRDKQISQLESLIQQLDIYSLDSLEYAKDQPFIKDFIKSFKQKEIKKRYMRLKQRVTKEKTNVLIEQYMKCAEEIQSSIEQLRKEGYVERTLGILKKRNQKALIYYQCGSRQLALAQINKIIEGGAIDQQNRDFQLAIAYLTKGKIQLQNREITSAYDSFEKSIEYFQKKSFQVDNGQLQVSQVSDNSQQSQAPKQKTYINNKTQDQICSNFEQLEAKILRLRVLLIYIEMKKGKQNGQLKVLYDQESKFWQNQSSFYMIMVQIQLPKLESIIGRGNYSQLQSDLLQVQFFYSLNLSKGQMKLTDIFKYFAKCIQTREINEGKGNLNNYLMCSDFVLRHYKRQDEIKYFLKCKYDAYLVKAEAELANSSHYWKIIKARYLILRHKQPTEEKQLEFYLKKAIQILRKQVNNKRNEYLANQLQQLRQFEFLENQRYLAYVDVRETQAPIKTKNQQADKDKQIDYERIQQNTIAMIIKPRQGQTIPHNEEVELNQLEENKQEEEMAKLRKTLKSKTRKMRPFF